jgi:hypothetical protein
MEEVTWKDEEFTELHSSSFTILSAIEKLNLKKEKSFFLQIVGCSKKECLDKLHMLNYFSKLFENVQNFETVEIHFIGPDLPIQEESEIELKLNSTLFQLKFFNKFYHEIDFLKGADLIFCPHAGIWLYPSWMETLNIFKSLNCPIIITSYAEIDSKWDQSVLSSYSFSFLWKSEPNSFQSLKKRKIETDQESIYSNENAYWICIQKEIKINQ